jgi:hypothetical protein
MRRENASGERLGIESRIAALPDPIRSRINRWRQERGLPAIEPETRPSTIVVSTTYRQSPENFEAAIARAPLWIRRKLNARRAAEGLPPVEPGAGASGLPANVTRVLMVAAHGYARPAMTGRAKDEFVMPQAFGTASELNARKGWHLSLNHGGGVIAHPHVDRLYAHDSDIGLVIEWVPTDADKRLVDQLRDGRARASVSFDSAKRCDDFVSDVVSRARLRHVAILMPGSGWRAAYAGSIVRVFDGPDTSAAFDAQLAALIKDARRQAIYG